MVYYAKERKLCVGVYEKVYLTEREDWILRELIEKGTIEIEKNNGLKVLISRLRKKSGLMIRSVAGFGYRLESEVYWGEDVNE